MYSPVDPAYAMYRERRENIYTATPELHVRRELPLTRHTSQAYMERLENVIRPISPMPQTAGNRSPIEIQVPEPIFPRRRLPRAPVFLTTSSSDDEDSLREIRPRTTSKTIKWPTFQPRSANPVQERSPPRPRPQNPVQPQTPPPSSSIQVAPESPQWYSSHQYVNLRSTIGDSNTAVSNRTNVTEPTARPLPKVPQRTSSPQYAILRHAVEVADVGLQTQDTEILLEENIVPDMSCLPIVTQPACGGVTRSHAKSSTPTCSSKESKNTLLCCFYQVN